MGSLFKKPKVRKQEITPQEKALTRRQDEALSREIEEENRRKKALFRGTLGAKSLLSGLPAAGNFTGVQFAGASKAGATPGPTGGASLLPPTQSFRPNITIPGTRAF